MKSEIKIHCGTATPVSNHISRLYNFLENTVKIAIEIRYLQKRGWKCISTVSHKFREEKLLLFL